MKMNILGRAYEYLDKGQHKKTNINTIIVGLFVIIMISFTPLFIKLVQVQKLSGKFLPAEFSLSTILLLASSWLIYCSKSQKEKDDYKKMRWCLLVTLVSGLLFFLFQYAGWQKLYANPAAKDSRIILVIVFVHALNFFASFLCLLVLFVNICRIKSPAELYIFFLNPKRNSFFLTSRSYWEFLGFLWTALYAVMLIKCF